MPNHSLRLNLKAVTSAALTMLVIVPIGFSNSVQAAAKKPVTKVLPKRKAGTKKVEATEAEPVPSETKEEAGDEIETMPRKSAINVDTKNAIRLNYGRRDWNNDSTKIDEAIIFLRDGANGRIVQIQAEETSPDSAVFSGTYSINWKTIESLHVEFFAPPQKLLLDTTGRKKVMEMMASKELRRLPYVLRRDPISGVQNIELFDNVEQARAAYRAFQSENELLTAMKNKAPNTEPTTTGALAEREQAIDTALLADRALFAKLSKDLADRVRLGQIESQRLSQLIQKYSALTPAERAQKKRDAQASADQAMIDYRAGRYSEARTSFDKAVELDPTNRSYYFQYGVTLYKLDEYNRSLVYLDLADGKEVNKVERDFYRGLNYYRLQDAKNALDAFAKVVAANDSEISPSANFYRGMIHFEKKSWPEARAEFQTVLDSSKDPALDERAEAYIESIVRQQQYDSERAHKWIANGTLGAIYDDNVLIASDSERDRGAATSLTAYRTLFLGSLRYRAAHEETQEFAAQFDFLTMMSVDKSFQAVQAITNADPTIATLTLPWTYKGVFLNKGYKFDFVPGYEMTFMSSDNNEFKAIYTSFLGGFQNLFVMNDRWYMNLNLELRQDNSNLTSSVGDDNSTALKSKLTWSNINFLEDKKQLILSDLSYTSNNSLGKNSVFDRVDMGVGYVRPWFANTTFLSKLSYYNLAYSQNSTGRVDNSYTLTLGLSRPYSEKITLGVTATYNINNSNVEANQYKRTNIMFTATASDAF